MNNDVVSRIKELMNYHSMNSLSFSKELGYKSSEKISRLFRDGGAKPSYDIIYDISNKFEINTDWLVTGRGQMLRNADVEQNPEAQVENNTSELMLLNMYNEEKSKVEAQAEQIGALKQTIRQLEDKIEGLQSRDAESDSDNEDAPAASIADAG